MLAIRSYAAPISMPRLRDGDGPFTRNSVRPPTKNQNIWFTLHDESGNNNNYVGYINTSNGGTTLFPVLTGQNAGLGEIALGPDANLWFAYNTSGSPGGGVGRVSPSGRIKLFPTNPPIYVDDVISGPDGDLWFAGDGEQDVVGRMNTKGRVLTETNVNDTTYQLTVGPDNNVWVTFASGSEVGLARFTSGIRFKAFKIPRETQYIPSGVVTGQRWPRLAEQPVM